MAATVLPILEDRERQGPKATVPVQGGHDPTQERAVRTWQGGPQRVWMRRDWAPRTSSTTPGVVGLELAVLVTRQHRCA